MKYTIANLPLWSLHPKPDREGLFVFFKKPWDNLQTSVKVTKDLNYAIANNLAPGVIEDYLNDKRPDKDIEVVAQTDLSVMLGEFLKDKTTHLKSATVDAYKGDIKRFIRSVGNIAEAITWGATRDYFAGIKASGRENKGHDNIVVNLRAFWNYLINDQKLIHLPNHLARVQKLGNYGRRDFIWYPEEYATYYDEAIPEDKQIIHTFWHTGMYPADYFFTRKKHIIPFEGDYVYQKLRQKANSPKALIVLPLKHCPARDIFIEAFERAKNPDDKIFVPLWKDSQYDKWNHTLNQRGRRLWERIYPDRERKTYPDIRHTFATECANGSRFGRMIPEWQLEKWLGWVPGSQMGAKYYFSAKSMPDLMKPQAIQEGQSLPSTSANFQDRLPFT